MGLVTPDRIRDFQQKLYVKAKQEPNFRFYSLYDKIYRKDILEHAYRRARSNKGGPGVDEETFEKIEEAGLEGWLERLGQELRERRYIPQPVKRAYMEKPGGGQRPLGIPTIKDRVAQGATKIVIEPIFEADFEDGMHGYRPKRSAQGAAEEVVEALRTGHTDVVDADLTKFFDTIPHGDLLKSVARRVSDGRVLHLIKLWLKSPVVERDGGGKAGITGGKNSKVGTPQGGVLSPLLANIYMNRFMRAWRERGEGRRLRAVVVDYADDFVILTRGKAKQALDKAGTWMNNIKLSMNEKKTRLCNARKETFNFLGYTFGTLVYTPTGKRYLGVKPSDKALNQLRDNLRTVLTPKNNLPWTEVAVQVNQITTGWKNYFNVGSVARSYWKINGYLVDKVRGFLSRRHKVPGRGTRRFTADWIFGQGGIKKLNVQRATVTAKA